MADVLFDFGFNGVTRSYGVEEGDEVIIVESMPAGGVQAILDANKRDEEDAKARLHSSDMGVVGARLDIVTWHNWRKEWREGPKQWGRPWHKFLKDRLNSTEYKHLRFLKL